LAKKRPFLYQILPEIYQKKKIKKKKQTDFSKIKAKLDEKGKLI
jgi:hypothetical protein